MIQYCFALDLKNDSRLIWEYENHHQHVWPEIIESLKKAGVAKADIYRTGSRLFMILETDEQFSLDKKAESDRENSRVQEWETLMWTYQQSLPHAKPGEKWVLMERIFSL